MDLRQQQPPLLRGVWPVFADELAAALVADGQAQLSAQVDTLRVVEPCRCKDEFCQSFYTAQPPDGPYGPGHANLWLDAPWQGYLILDLVDDAIMFVEVLYRSPLS